jgi:hypothetical protein
MSSILGKLPSFGGLFSTDVGFLIAVFLVILGISFFIGRSSLISLILSFYPATLLYKTFPFTSKAIFLKGELLETFNKIGLFLLFLILITIIVSRFVHSVYEYTRGDSSLRIFGLSIAFLILVVFFSYDVVNYDVFHNFGSQIDAIFTIKDSQFYWNIAPIALLAFL